MLITHASGSVFHARHGLRRTGCLQHSCYAYRCLLQDIDVAYATDPGIFDDFEADLSSLLEVPDFNFPWSQEFPSATYRDSAFASSSAAGKLHLAGPHTLPSHPPPSRTPSPHQTPLLWPPQNLPVSFT